MNKTAQNSRFGIGKKIASAFLSAAMLATSLTGLGGVLTASTPVDAAASDYGLMDTCQEGVILHAWQWSFNNIKDNMARIAEAGYTSVQTSVIQQAKEGTKGKGNNVWWLYYQPANFTIDNTGNSALGTKAEFAAMCQEAHKYGIHVIVDVVANHLGNNSGYDKAPAIPSDIKDDPDCWHDLWNKEINYGSRYSITHGSMGGLPDLNSENPKIQNYVKKYLRECIDCGADGFRFDAAKHIGVPNDTEGAGGDFWPNVLNDAYAYYKTKGTFSSGLYCYGEILDGTGGPSVGEYTKYMSVTDNKTGNGIRDKVADHNASGAATNYYNLGAGANKTVLWAESHDTYSNDSKESTGVSDSDINKTWALVGSRNNATALYFARTSGWRGGNIGQICSTQCFNKEVVEVNKFHNYFNGQSEYLSSSGSIAYNERGTSGVVLVNCSGGSQSVSVKANKMAAGDYIDQVTGNKFTVSDGQISGQIGNTGIAVVYNATPITKSAIVSAEPGNTSFTSSAISVTLGVKNASSGSYTTSEGKSGTYSNGDKITVGSSIAVGGSVTVTLSATGEDGETKTATYTYTKKDPSAVTTIYFDNSTYNWSSVYAYVYTKGSSPTPTPDPTPDPDPTPSGTILFSDTLGWGSVNAYFFANNAAVGTAWPGTAMTNNGTNEFGQAQFKISVPSGAEYVVFNSGSNKTSNVKLTGATGYYCDGSPTNVKSWTSSGSGAAVEVIKTTSSSASTVPSNAKWPGVKMTLDPSTGYYMYEVPDDFVNGYVIFAESETATTNRYPADGADGLPIEDTTKLFSANHSWKAYTPVPGPDPEPDVPTVTANKASGSSFTTETMSLTLTLANAKSGTYSVDGGPTKTFSSSATFNIGEGKIGDSTVTVAATATGSDGTKKNYTFTYEKKYVVKTTSSSGSLSSYYATNPTGVGKEKTITIDGNASDWSEDMLIAQGAAWDVANHWKGGHENCILDTYALFAAWDNTNLYIGWQMVNTCDTWANPGDGPLSDGGRVLDVPLILALSIDPSSVSMTNKNSTGGSIWGKSLGLEFDTHVDRLFYMSGKPGLGKPSMFKAADAQGNTNYTDGCVGFKEGGIEYKMATTNICSHIYGLNSSDSPTDVSSDSADWVDYKTTSHDTKFDSFYEIKIPLATLGIDKNYLTTNGIGAMLVATRGESALDCIPYDLSMVDNAKGDYASDPSTSHEKDDVDVITASLAKIGNGTINPTPTPTPDPTTPLQVNFGTDKSAPQLTTTALTLKGIGMGGTAPYQYTFYVDGNVVKSKSTTATYTWKPGTKGQHTIKCVITDSTGATAKTEKTFTAEGDDIDDPTPSTLANNSTISATSVAADATVKLTAKASGGTSPYTYTYRYRKSGTTSWKYLGSTNVTTATKSFSLSTAGTYEVQVLVKDSTGKVASKDFSLVVKTSGSTALANNSTVSATSVSAGTKVTLTGKVSGGTSPYYYTFEYMKPGSSDYTLIGSRNSTTVKTASFVPQTAGTYVARILIKDGSGKVVSKKYEVKVSGSSSALVNNSTISTTSITLGGSAKLTGKASGGTSPYNYTYQYKLSSASTWATQGTKNGTATTATLSPNTKGTYNVRVIIKDSTGAAQTKTFTLKVT